MPIKTSIVCTHCGETFSITLPTSGGNNSGSLTVMHSPGCRGETNVHYNQGAVDKTKKR